MEKCTTPDFIAILKETPQSEATPLWYDVYMSGNKEYQTPHDADVAALSAELGRQLAAHSVSDDTLCDYEEASKRAGFYAGFRIAVAYLHFLQQMQEV